VCALFSEGQTTPSRLSIERISPRLPTAAPAATSTLNPKACLPSRPPPFFRDSAAALWPKITQNQLDTESS